MKSLFLIILVSLFSSCKQSEKETQINALSEKSELQTQANIIYSTTPVTGIPQVWIEQRGPDVLRYANYIKSLNLKNIHPYKELYPHFKVRNRVRNSLPPRHLWENIAETLKVVDQLSTILDAEVKPFLSSYRSPKYNRSVRGRAKSQSLLNNAVSITFVGVTPEEVAIAAKKLRFEGKFKGGIGKYTMYIALDTRGSNVDW